MCFDNLAAAFTITMGQRYVPLWQIFMRIFFICLTTFFQKYFEWRSCIIFMKEVMSLTIFTMEIVKSQFFSYHSNSCFVQKKLYQKFEFDGLELPLEKID